MLTLEGTSYNINISRNFDMRGEFLNNELMIKQLKAISEIKRLEIIKNLNREEKCACVLLENLDLTQSGLSYHMKILTDAKIVESRSEGKWMHYSINNEFKKNLKEFIEML